MGSIDALIEDLKKKRIQHSIYLHPMKTIYSDVDWTIVVSSLEKIDPIIKENLLDESFFIQTYEHLFNLVKWEQLPTRKPALSKLGGQYILYERLKRATFRGSLDIRELTNSLAELFDPNSYYVALAYIDLGLQDLGFGIMYNNKYLREKGFKRIQEYLDKLQTELQKKGFSQDEIGALEAIDVLSSQNLLLRIACVAGWQNRFSPFKLNDPLTYGCFYYDSQYSQKTVDEDQISKKLPVLSLSKNAKLISKTNFYFVSILPSTENIERENLLIKKELTIKRKDKNEAKELLENYFPYDERLIEIVYGGKETPLQQLIQGKIPLSYINKIKDEETKRKIKDELQKNLNDLFKEEVNLDELIENT